LVIGSKARGGAVSRNDVADAPVAVLLRGAEHDGRTYNVTGPEAITLHEAAEELSRATTRRITYHAETVEEAYSEFTAPPTRMVA